MRIEDFANHTDSEGLEISDLMVSLVAVLILGIMTFKDIALAAHGERTSTQHKVNNLVQSTLENVQGIPGIEILPDGTVRFRGSFKQSETDLTDEMKSKLDDACKPIIHMTINHPDLIDLVIFEGHSSEGWESDKLTPYYGNHEYSSWRATNAMRYCLGEKFEATYPELMHKFIAIPYSFSRPVRYSNGQPNWSLSRRVDIKVVAAGNNYEQL